MTQEEVVIIQPVSAGDLDEYARVPIRFDQYSVLEVHEIDDGLGGLRFVETATRSTVKDSDELDGQRPTDWPERFDLSRWSFALARDRAAAIGAAAWVIGDPGIHLLRGRRDAALLWDLRVAPDHRRRGVGTALFDHVVEDARAQGCRELRVETQNTNVAACRFYSARGARLAEVDRYHYIDTPETAREVMLIWQLDLRRGG